MDEDARTIWCGNLSSNCTELILYELFLQAGPLEKVNIPKDRDGTIKTFGFITYKHEISVPYALSLFEGTSLFNRVLTLKTRQNPDLMSSPLATPPMWKPNIADPNSILQYGHQMLNNQMYNFQNNLLPMFIPSGMGLYPSQVNSSFAPVHEHRRVARNHPYNRDRERDREREREHDRNQTYRDRNHHKNFKDHNREHKNHKNQRSHNFHGRSRRNNH